MFLIGAIFRFGKFVLIFLFIVVVIWIVVRVFSFVIRWLLDQLGIEVGSIRSWLKSKLPRRRKKKPMLSIDDLSNEDLHRIAIEIAKLEDGVDLD